MNAEMITDTGQLSGEQREIAETIGIEAYKKLVERFGGCHIYICKIDTIQREIRNKEIQNNFNGFNYRELARKYNLSEKAVREIISRNDKNNCEQLGFF